MRIFVRDKRFYTEALHIALPVVAQQTINMGVNLMDTVMLGALGEVPISGSSLANQFFFIFNVLCLGMGGGAAVMKNGAVLGSRGQEVYSQDHHPDAADLHDVGAVLFVPCLLFPQTDPVCLHK